MMNLPEESAPAESTLLTQHRSEQAHGRLTGHPASHQERKRRFRSGDHLTVRKAAGNLLMYILNRSITKQISYTLPKYRGDQRLFLPCAYRMSFCEPVRPVNLARAACNRLCALCWSMILRKVIQASGETEAMDVSD